MSDFLDELTGETIGGIQTDHGELTIGDVLVLILDLVLLVYTGWRSYDFLTTTVPDGWQMLALIGLWGLDIGAVFWSLTWIFGSTGKFQNWVSVTMFLVDLSGVALTGLTDSLMYGDKGAMVDALGGITRIAVPIVMFLNVLAGFIYHMTSPQTKDRRKKRELQAEHNNRMRQVREAQLKLTFTQAQLLARQETVELAQVMAQIKVAQDQIEQNARKRLRDNRMANVQGQLNLLTGNTDVSPGLFLEPQGMSDADMSGLQSLITQLNQKTGPGSNALQPVVQPGKSLNILGGLQALKNKLSGIKNSANGTSTEDDLTNMQEALKLQLEEAQRTRELIDELKAKIEQPNIGVASGEDNHPNAGSNGGHSANPT